MFDISDFGVDTNRDAGSCFTVRRLRCLGVAIVDEGRVSVYDCRSHVEHAPNGHWIEESTWICRDEGGSRVREAGAAAEGELKGVLEEETAEAVKAFISVSRNHELGEYSHHEIMSIAILRLHYACILKLGVRHGDYIMRQACRIMRVM